MNLDNEETLEIFKDYILKYESTPNKSQHDTKEYSVIKLKNGLTAMLISDIENLINFDENKPYNQENYNSNAEASNTSKFDNKKQNEKLAACSVTVGNAGSFNDLEEIPGLAHFVEHMLMMGSKNYPEENDFSSFLNKVGGSDNATTDLEHTTFYFDCPELYFQEALKRFSDFFKNPLMKNESMTREREAVESEFQMHYSSDTCRGEQIFSTTASPGNPACKFKWGNLKTLQENTTDEELYEAIHKFWKKYYVANRMTVAVQARLSINILEKLVVECFHDIKHSENNEQLPKDNLFNMELFNKFYIIEPIIDKNELHMTWILTPKKYKTKPESYAEFLIAHEGDGSLLSNLKKKLWALNLLAGSGSRHIETNSMYSTFKIIIELTEQGLKNYNEVIRLTFGYIKLIKKIGPVEWIFKEIQTTYQTCFNFSQETATSDNVEELSQKMQLYQSTDYLTGGTLIFEYNADDIIDVLDALTPDAVNIMIWSKTLANQEALDQIEPWFNTKYKKKNIKEDSINEWNNSEVEPDFHLPKPNSYITTDFSMLPSTTDEDEPPQKIISNDSIEVWYKLVTKFKRPIGYVHFYLISPFAITNAKNLVIIDLFVTIFTLSIQEEVYAATVASMSYSVIPSFCGIIITVDGFNQKLHLFLKRILIRLTNFYTDVTEGLFNIVKQNLLRNYSNLCKDPDVLESEIRIKLLIDPFWNNLDKINVLKDITYQNLLDFNDPFFKNLYVKCLIQGNISEQEAHSMVNSFKNIINYNPIEPGLFPEIKLLELPIGAHYIRVKALNESDMNCNVTNYYQTSKKRHIEESSKIELLMLIMNEPLYNILRTQEQLAYDVSCSIRDTFGVLGWIICVKSQADKYPVDYIEERITEFLKYFETKLNEMTLIEFNEYKKTLIRLKQQVDTHIHQEVLRNWIEIVANNYNFKKRERQIEYIRTLKPEDIHKHFINTLTLSDNEISLRKLSVQVDAEIFENNEENDNSSEVSEGIENEYDNEENKRMYRKDEEDKNYGEIKVQLLKPENTTKNFIMDIQEFTENCPNHALKIYN